jgi:hypothetical protein
MSVCDKDGGDSLKGSAHPNFGDGSTSVYVPPSLKPAFERAVNDPDLLNFGRKLALMEAREEQLLKRIDTGETDRNWTALQQHWQVMWEATDAGEKDKIQEQRMLISQLIARGQADAIAWQAIYDHWVHYQRMAEGEMRRREKARQMVPVEDAMWHFGEFMASMRIAVKERKAIPVEEQDGLLQDVGQIYHERFGSRFLPGALDDEGTG